jgi:DNA-binding transcriptional ArsR family regulator
MAYQQALQALADPTRRLVFDRLRGGPLPVGRVARGLRVTRPAVSQHLRVLERAGLVSAERDGTRRLYRIERRGLEDLRRYLDRFWDDVLESFRMEAEHTPKASPKTPIPPASRRKRRSR